MHKGIAAIVLLLGVAPVVARADAYKAALTGTAEVPPVTSAATGSATITTDPSVRMFTGRLVLMMTKITWSVSYSGLTPAEAHIHCGALPGVNAGIALSLPGADSNPIVGSGMMVPTQSADLAAGKCYINIVTADHTAGEIRGQIEPD